MLSADESFLRVENLTVGFGGVRALENLSFTMNSKQILGLIGPNGSGKTTFFNCLSRIYQPLSGDIFFNNYSLLQEREHGVIRLGITRTFQNLALFRSMTVLDNVLIGAHTNTPVRFFGDFLKLRRAMLDQHMKQDAAIELLHFLELDSLAYHRVVDLPFVTQKRVELARALISKPKLLLLDEPANGLSHLRVEELKKLIHKIRDEQGIAILLVEHNMKLVMDVSESIVVLNFGKKIAEGPPRSIQQNSEVIDSYLGKRVS